MIGWAVMKKVLLLFAVVLMSSVLYAQASDRPQPFGFHVGMSQQEAISAVGKSAVKAGSPQPQIYGSSLGLATAPKPNRLFDHYQLKFSADGLIEVRAYTSGIPSADNGAQVRDEFDELRKLITNKYGEPKCFDYRDSGASERPDFFMMYLKDKEQHLNCYWQVSNDFIELDALGVTINAAMIAVTYQFYPEVRRAKALADEKEKSTF
jgi:hypothetical protein